MGRKYITASGILKVMKNAFAHFGDDKVAKLSGSLAYSTVFSFGPLLIVIISLCGFFLGREAIEGQVYRQLVSFVGTDTAKQLQEIIKNASLSGKSLTAAVIGAVTLLIGATAIFSEIQDSINSIWGIKPKPKKGWLQFLKNRLLSFSVIIGLGFLLLVSLSVNTVVDAFNTRLQRMFPDVAIVVFYILNMVITLLVVSLIFAVIFKVLPDADIKWRDIRAGAVVTGLLFMLGKAAISFYISKTNVGSTYGAAGSLVILLVWVYYSSIILYFGAEFTKAFTAEYGRAIHPNQYSVATQTVEIEKGKEPVNKQD
ncbi:MAG: YihY/virulence factor BrkB family protein [Ferruginibacter sp.]